MTNLREDHNATNRVVRRLLILATVLTLLVQLPNAYTVGSIDSHTIGMRA